MINNLNKSITSKTLILGVGNPLRGDDGIGPKIIELLQKESLPTSIHILDGGTDGLNLIEEIKPYPKAIIIDAVNMKAKPGTIRAFSPEEVTMIVSSDALSTHGFGLAEVVSLMQSLGVKTELTIIGIQPQNIEFGMGLSDVITQTIPSILKLLPL